MSQAGAQSARDPDLFVRERRRLIGIAYRMLGSVAEAEDLVQDAFLKFHDVQPGALDNPAAWLTTVVTRLAIDRLRRLQVERAAYPGQWLPEPWCEEPQAPSAEERAATNQHLSLGFLMLLERLNAVERATLLLHDVLDHECSEIARIVEKSEANVRQILRRARERVRDPRREARLAPQSRANLLARLWAAVQHGDGAALAALLAEHAEFRGDGGGKVSAATKPLHGGALVARFLLGVTGPYLHLLSTEPITVNAMPALAWKLDGKLLSVMVIDAEGEHITRIYNVANPDKLRQVAVACRLDRYAGAPDAAASGAAASRTMN